MTHQFARATASHIFNSDATLLVEFSTARAVFSYLILCALEHVQFLRQTMKTKNVFYFKMYW